ncbi:MAG: TrkA family potassium uptake protein [Endomicrobia bacterium]|nr:TrkA family potassium uptake protein [Endomicrobiia bacterium]MCX7716456.1 TrkA family potassium uptake protein [Endomicrobiia bacterium]
MVEEKPKTFAVIGLGIFGSSVVRHLSRYNVDIIGIDKDETKVEAVKRYLKIPVVGDAMDVKQLEQAGINAQDIDFAIVAIGENVETNVYVSLLLKEMGIKKVMSRALNSQHASILAKIGVDRVIFPEESIAEQLVRSLLSPQIIDQLEISEDYSIVEVRPPKEFIGKTLHELNVRARYKITVLGIKRKTTIINDAGETDTKDEILLSLDAGEKIEQSDILIIMGKNTDIEKFKRI